MNIQVNAYNCCYMPGVINKILWMLRCTIFATERIQIMLKKSGLMITFVSILELITNIVMCS